MIYHENDQKQRHIITFHQAITSRTFYDRHEYPRWQSNKLYNKNIETEIWKTN